MPWGVFKGRRATSFFFAGKIILLVLISAKLQEEPSWGKLKSGKDIGKEEAGKSGKCGVYIGL